MATDDLRVDIDPGYGCDILSLVAMRTHTELLFRTPWRARADLLRTGQQNQSTHDPTSTWLERYRGGWQILCPVAGAPRRVHGAYVGFHGEASVLSWTVDDCVGNEVVLHVELFAIPLRIDRRIKLDGPTLSVIDTITNQSSSQLNFDLSHHPAFGGDFLAGECRITTGAKSFTSDYERASLLPAGKEHAWPMAIDTNGGHVDLSTVLGPGGEREVFGWLHDFTEPWAALTNHTLGLTVRLDWDGSLLPYAWLWQELNATEGFPWFKRARTVAIEPASCPTSGSARESVLHLPPGAEITVPLRLTVQGEEL